MDALTKQKIHRTWDELADFDVGHSEQAAIHFMEALCELCDARNATWGGAARLDDEHKSDPLQGWRVAAMKLLRPIDLQPDEGPFKEILKQWDPREIDPSFLLPMRGVGQFRTYVFRRDLPPEWFESPFYHAHYGAVGTHDAAYVGFPLSRDAESHFGFYSDHPFGAKEIELLAYAVRGIKWFHRQLMLHQGVLVASSPLTPTERKVLHLLLTDASEKGIADQLGLAASTAHQHIVAVFRKYGVRSRAGVMSLWLNRGG